GLQSSPGDPKPYAHPEPQNGLAITNQLAGKNQPFIRYKTQARKQPPRKASATGRPAPHSFTLSCPKGFQP
ncbi:hypothetical protein, partial [Pseudomonas sichuanensis]|uniref:hypothetical protein n=1 Tax=Pseudomonas sichuanensis TaxID=2213015 RepID=UPI001ABF8AA4